MNPSNIGEHQHVAFYCDRHGFASFTPTCPDCEREKQVKRKMHHCLIHDSYTSNGGACAFCEQEAEARHKPRPAAGRRHQQRRGPERLRETGKRKRR